MSLIVSLFMNSCPIGRMVITRVHPVDLEMLPDTVSTYEVTVNGKPRGRLEHRYGDGAWELTRKAIEETVP